MDADRWTPEFLASMRKVADPATDPLIEETLTQGGQPALVELNRYLQTWNAPPPENLAPGVRRYLSAPVEYPSWVDRERLATAQAWFSEWGLLALMSLFLKALPQYFADADACQVFRVMDIFRAESLKRFVVEIAQLTFDVMAPGGLDVDPDPPQPGVAQTQSSGVVALRKLRLHHSIVRRQVLAKSEREGAGWDPAWGSPLNQEDLALAVASYALWTLDGARKLKIEVSAEDEAGGLEAWKVIGFLIGMDDRLQPADPEEARRLMAAIGQRQFRRSEVGIALVRQLLERVEGFLPRFLRGLPAALMRYLMEPYFVDLMAIPRSSRSMRGLLRVLGLFLGEIRIFARLANHLAGRLLAGLKRATGRDGERGAFRIPERQVQRFG
ncbi:MAG TPA: oxygenase MpaB family protein [Thermoanaerobaculia bacterium]|jgi:hypothetical protein|nr:oxygenase MpaB family protein [Thermoanaerobaculia bacterium]